MNPFRFTVFLFLRPKSFIDHEWPWDKFDLESWSENRYTWSQDDLNGLLDYAQSPNDTLNSETGDCEDYALVALSNIIDDDPEEAGLGFLYTAEFPPKAHVIAYDDKRIYSSGQIREQSPEEYRNESRYDYMIKRPVK